MSPPLSRRVEQIPGSGIRRIFDLATELNRQGRTVYPFHLGMPNFDTPAPIKTAAIRKLEEGFVHYAPNAGIPELRETIAASINRRRGTRLSGSQVIVTVGACEAISIALLAILEVGDEILVPTPCWMNYLHLPAILGARAVELFTGESGFIPDPDAVASHLSPRTRAIILSTPSNPTGVVIPPKVIRELVQLAQERNLWLIGDEIYEDIIYDGYAHTSPLTVPGAEEVVIGISGLSKTYSMTGWRLGYVVGPTRAIAGMLKAHTYLVTSACSFTQWGALTALCDEPGKVEMQREYQTRRDLTVAGLQAAGLEFELPGGSFFAFPKIPDRYPNDEAFCREMLEHHGIAVVPGSVFGAGYERYFRLCFACSRPQVEAGMNQLVQAIQY